MCDASHCLPDGSPWRLVTYNQHLVGGSDFPGCRGRVKDDCGGGPVTKLGGHLIKHKII